MEVKMVKPAKAAVSRLCVASTSASRSLGRRRPKVATMAPKATRIEIHRTIEPS
ncbi:hypothetical protein D3C72_2562440 [compost metagenome]